MSRTKFAPVDWASCLLPFDGEPCGPALQNDPVYAAIREARREEDPDLPQGVWERELKRADWELVLSLSYGVLQERSKDMQVAGWACEAALMFYGFSALAGGLRMVAGLISSFGEDLHPQTKEGDQEARLARLSWLDTTLAERAASLPITESAPDSTDYSYATWVAMEHHERLQNGNGNGKNLRQTLNLAGTQSSVEFHTALHGQLCEALLALDQLTRTAEEFAKGEAPSFHTLRDMLERINARVLAWHPIAAPAPLAAASSPLPVPDMSSREQAYASLAAIADYLMRIEPHSPAPWLVKRAVVWGGMSLAELLGELLGQGENLASIRKLLGISNGNAEK